MKVALKDLQNGFQSLAKLAQADLPIKPAYRLAKIAKGAESELKELDEQRIKLIKKHGEDKDGNWQVLPDNLMAFNEEFTALLTEEVEIWGDQITLDDLGDKLQLSAVDLINLEWLFKPEEEAEPATVSQIADRKSKKAARG